MRLGPAALTRAVVVFRCPKNSKHVHKLPATEVVEFTEDYRVMSFKQFIECPACWKDVGAFAPPFSSVAGIEWEPPTGRGDGADGP